MQRYVHDGLRFPHRVPLQPCNVTAWVAILACIWLRPLAVEYSYFLGIAAPALAVLTPDSGMQWPIRFYITHAALISTGCVLVYGRLATVRPGAVWRCYGLFAVYALLTGIFDWLTGANYAYLRGKPGHFTAYNWLGPWPFYILSAAALALALFWLLWLPVRPVTRRAELGTACAAAVRT